MEVNPASGSSNGEHDTITVEIDTTGLSECTHTCDITINSNACHNTTLYVDAVAVAHDHVPVDLAPGESYTGCFNGYVWTYTSPSDNITVCADNNETLDELDEANNCLTNIWMCGDIRKDGFVTAWDVAVLNSKVAGIGAISCMCTQPDL